MTRRREVFVAGALASVGCGVLCAWTVVASLFVGSDPADEIGALVPVLLVAMVIGAAVGGVLGMVPTIVLVIVWGPLQSRLGADRAVGRASLLASGVALVELLLLLRDRTDGLEWETVAWAMAWTAIAGGCTWVALRSARRSSRRAGAADLRTY